jgi:hypothetical protein
VVLGACLVGGALADAWAHTNIISEIESFFTPWHALLYGGFAGTAGWTFWLAYRRAGSGVWRRDGWPAGYAVGGLGAVLFLLGGVGDMIWHTIFGIETGLDAALSPTHLLLVASATLLLTSPLRSWWANVPTRVRAVTGVASLALGTTFAMILLGDTSALRSIAPTHVYDHVHLSPSHLEASAGMVKYLFTTLALLAPVLLVLRRRATFGTATAVVGAVSLFGLAQFEFPTTQTVAAASATVAAAAFDLLVVRLDAVRGPRAPLRLPLAGALFAVLVWSAHLVGLQAAAGVRWPVALWTGVVVLSALLGALLGGLASPPTQLTDRLGQQSAVASDQQTGSVLAADR